MNIAFIAIPTSISLRGERSFPVHESIYIKMQATTPPQKARPGIKKYSCGKNAVITTATKLAPELIPSIPGSANGFFMTA